MEKENCFVVIMAGGVGSRFWPFSRSKYPKQFQDILGTGNNSILYNNENYFTYFQDSWGYTIAFPIQGTISCFNANPDYLKTRFHTKAAAINVLCNDISLHPQLAAIEEPQNGTLQWETNGNVFYTPNEDFTGLERLIYTLQNADGITDTSILTIEVAGEDYEQCFDVVIEEGTIISGKATVSSGKVSINIAEGTAPFNVFVNNKLVFNTYAPEFIVPIKHGDIVAVKTKQTMYSMCFNIFFNFFNTQNNYVFLCFNIVVN